MPLVMPDEQMSEKPVFVMIVGTPGSKKSSFSMTAKDCIHIDGDQGAQRAIRTCPVLDVKSWAEIRLAYEQGVFKGKKTVVFDTPKSLLDDFLWEWCQQQKYYADDRKVYGAIATELKAFVAKLKLDGIDLVFVCHEKSSEKKNGVVYEPDITGQTKQLLLRLCDQIGFMEKREVKGANGQNTIQTVLTFDATPELPFCKNTGRVDDIVIPIYTIPEWKTIFNDRVIQPLKDAMAKMSDEQKAALEFISGWHIAIDAIDGEGDSTSADLLETMSGAEGIVAIKEEHLKTQIRSYFMAHLKKIGYKWDKTVNEGKGGFVPAVAKAAETPPGETVPPVEQTQPPVSPSIQFPEQVAAEEEEKDPFENQSE